MQFRVIHICLPNLKIHKKKDQVNKTMSTLFGTLKIQFINMISNTHTYGVIKIIMLYVCNKVIMFEVLVEIIYTLHDSYVFIN